MSKAKIKGKKFDTLIVDEVVDVRQYTAKFLNLDVEPGRGWALNKDDQFIIYHVWTVGTYKNGHPMFNLRAVTTSMPKAKMYSKMLRRDKEANGEDWYRVHIEPRVANHLYGESMLAMRESTKRL